jgi:hypothetical protein
MTAFAGWLAGIGSWAWHSSLTLGIVFNVGAVLAVIVTRDRRLVDRWTGPWLGVNVALLGVGVGVPAAAWFLRTAVSLIPTFTLAK